MGFTALPEYPPSILCPFTPGSDKKLSKSIFMMLRIVLIAATPSEPAATAAFAGISIWLMFGVIFASTGSLVPFRTAAV